MKMFSLALGVSLMFFSCWPKSWQCLKAAAVCTLRWHPSCHPACTAICWTVTVTAVSLSHPSWWGLRMRCPVQERSAPSLRLSSTQTQTWVMTHPVLTPWPWTTGSLPSASLCQELWTVWGIVSRREWWGSRPPSWLQAWCMKQWPWEMFRWRWRTETSEPHVPL